MTGTMKGKQTEEMDGDIAGVRIIPPIVEFVDATVNQLYTSGLTVQNVSKFSKRIRFHEPVTDKFKLTVKNPSKPVAPGLEIFATIEYSSDVIEDSRDRIILSVDDDIVEIPLYAYTPTPLLDLEGPVDFGMVVANSSVLTQEVALINHGSMAGEFSITYNGKHPIVISPACGKVNPKTIQLIKVDLVTESPGEIDEVANVALEGMQDTKLCIKASIVEQSLQLIGHDKASSLSCVAFGPAYYGTDKIEPAYLFNNGPDPIKWVSILEEGADGEEAGTDLTKSTAAMLATSPMEKIRGRAFDVLTSLITVLPNQGTIGPYQKVPVSFRFSPRFNSSSVGWEATEKPPPRQDFALFMRFEMVGSNDSFLSDNLNPHKKIEIAVTATAVPVLVNIQPSSTFDFGEILCGDHTSALCTLTNESSLLPLSIQCRKMAHFNITPKDAKIKPGKSQDIMISFQPNQAGKFEPLQLIDVLGKVCVNRMDDSDILRLSVMPFQTIPLQLTGVAVAVPRCHEPRINPGITPQITNETGRYPDVSVRDVKKVEGQLRPFVVNSGKSRLHTDSTRKAGTSEDKCLIAFPNDRAQSIRPSKRGERYVTPYTKKERHHYVDRDYAYTIEEEHAKQEHKAKYKQFLKECSEKRENKERTEEFKGLNNSKDLGLKPASGLRPPKLSVREIESPGCYQTSPLEDKQRLLTTRQLVNQERQATTRPVSDGLNAVPTTSTEKIDCKRVLTPQDLHKIIVGPPTIDFGEVCLRSTNSKHLHVVNNLNQFIHVQVFVESKELRQTSPLSQVIPARSKAQFALVFESNATGKFQRSISYAINSQHESHVLVLASVVPVALELSSENLELTAEPGLPTDAGYRSIVTLHNRRNYAADFTWSPILSDRGTAFSIRPATGTVEAFQDLKCEVVFHPSYFAPLEGEFHLQVFNGNSLKLKCRAKLGAVNVQFVERRILFGYVPLNMSTTRTALLHNTGHNHAMFYVINSAPFPGMTVSPVHGVVPVGGNAELKVTLSPTAVVKFDTWIQVNIRGWKTIDLRMGGTVEPPEVDIDVKAFRFSGVYCDSAVSIPFNLINMTTTRVRAEFDLAKYTDFALTFPEEKIEADPRDLPEPMNPHSYCVELAGMQTLSCVLTFHPTSIASYDFTLPVVINKTGAPSPTPSTFPPTPAPSERHIITPRPVVITIPTPRRRVLATGLRPTLELSASRLDFALPVSFMAMNVPENVGGDKKQLTLSNKSPNSLDWQLDMKSILDSSDDVTFAFLKPGGAWYTLDNVSGHLGPDEDTTITIVFTPKKAGTFQHKIPIYLNNDKAKPYRFLTLHGLLQPPSITFDPLALVLTPVPLATAVYAEFNIVASGYASENTLTVEVPDVEADDGSTVSCFSIDFPNGPTIPAQSTTKRVGDSQVTVVIPCLMTFSSDRPISATVDLTFTDQEGRKFAIPVTATADNCLLTVYPFLAAHRNDHQIVCEQDKTLRGPANDAHSASLGEAVLLPCVSPHRPSTRGSTSATSSHFGASSSSFDDSSNTASESEFVQSSRDGAHPGLPANSDTTATSQHHRQLQQQASRHATLDVASMQKQRITLNKNDSDTTAVQRELMSRSLGSAVFPFESSMEAHFHQEVLVAAQRWFSSHGWPGGPFPIAVPQTVRKLVTRLPSEDDDARAKAPDTKKNRVMGGWDTALKKDVKTIYDMLHHLCGRMVPGIPINQPLPRDPTERVLQLHWQHSTLLTFLRGQGASVSAIRPEFLLTPRDYRRWVKVRERQSRHADKSDECSEASGSAREPDSEVPKESSMLEIEDELFESVSKRAWTDLLLQLFKVLVLSRITPAQYKSLKSPDKKKKSLPGVNPDPLASNVYSTGERIVLAWLNYHYEQQRQLVWGDRPLEQCTGGIPPSRWVVNFDYDLLDGLVLAAAVAAYCPWLISQHFREMYTAPNTPEQCLHNTLILVRALRSIGVSYDIQATDITDPNPITLLLLCVHLYQNLPQYAPKSTVDFVGALHATVRRQVRLTNPSSKTLKYTATIAGRDANDFQLPGGNDVTVPQRGEMNIDVLFTSRLIRPAEAVLVLVGRRENAQGTLGRAPATIGSTLVFSMRTAVDDIHPTSIVKTETPCYQLTKLLVPIMNTFTKAGNFRIVLVESSDGPPSPLDIGRRHGMVRSQKKSLSSRIKSVKSKIDHGQQKDPSPPPSPPLPERTVPEDGKTPTGRTMTSQLTAFFCAENYVYLEPGVPADLQLEFLPFSVGKKFCSVLLVNEDIGEFLHAVEAVSSLPLPSRIPFNSASPHSVRISSAAAAEKGKGFYGGDDRVVYWKCENDSTLKENLFIPITNESKEFALRTAARQRMSDKEKHRRQLTGTLDSGSVTAAVAAMGLVESMEDQPESFTHPTSAPPRPRGTTFEVEASSEWFDVPRTLTIPSPMTFGPPPASEIKDSKTGPNDRQDDGTIPLEVRFTPRGPGHYPCDVVLKSAGDIRMYRIECTVNPAGTNARFEFHVPAHQSITQSIPIQNASNHDWQLECTVDGEWFHGPSHMTAKAGQTTYYPLMFKPHVECSITGVLTIRNKSDGTEHVFNLRGVGESPLALEHMKIRGKCREVTKRTVVVPNFSPYSITYRVFSDIPFLEGNKRISVVKGETETYTFTLSPWQRGTTGGVLVFVEDDAAKLVLNRDDSDGDEIKDADGTASSKTPSYLKPKLLNDMEKLGGYRVWYSLEVVAEPSDPIGVLQITCPVQRSQICEIPIKNPSGESVDFEVKVSGDSVKGADKLTLAPRVPATYRLRYSPCVVGESEGSVVFSSEMTGEFWYRLQLSCVSPPPTHLPMMNCQLGSWSRQYINIHNPSDEPMLVELNTSNEMNFSLDIPLSSTRISDKTDGPPAFVVQNQSSMEIPIQFMATTLGTESHQATVTLRSKQLGEVVYLVSGRGLAPSPMEPLSVSAASGSSTSLILPFRNPTDVTVLADVTITDHERTMNSISPSLIRNNVTNDSAFCLLLKHTSNIRLGPLQTLDIPFTFAPDMMRRHEGALTISLRREDRKPWPSENDGIEEFGGSPSRPSDDLDRMRSLSIGSSGSVRTIRWVFPIHGIPEVRSKESKEATLQCQARSRIEERLEVTLTGAVPSSASGCNVARLRAVTPMDQRKSSMISDGVAVEGHAVAEEFAFKIEYPSLESRQQLDQALAVSLIRKERDPHTGMVLLLFHLVFSPFKMLTHTVSLLVTSATGGIWRFPLTLRASEPPPDDVISVEAAGLGKGSTVTFVLFSHSKHATPFNAFFVAGTDPELTVNPPSGELQPPGTNGTKLSVTFTPNMYGRSYKGRLIVQTLDMQWTYDVRGITPEYQVPNVPSAILTSTLSRPRPLAQRRRVNYVRKNLKLTATAVSSPIKGTRLANHIHSQ